MNGRGSHSLAMQVYGGYKLKGDIVVSRLMPLYRVIVGLKVTRLVIAPPLAMASSLILSAIAEALSHLKAL